MLHVSGEDLEEDIVIDMECGETGKQSRPILILPVIQSSLAPTRTAMKFRKHEGSRGEEFETCVVAIHRL